MPPSVGSAHAKAPPVSTCWNSTPIGSSTSVGVAVAAVVPPRRPSKSLPRQYTRWSMAPTKQRQSSLAPSVASGGVLSVGAAILGAVITVAITTFAPIPTSSIPRVPGSSLRPQHKSSPAIVDAQVSSPPSATCTIVIAPRPSTAPGASSVPITLRPSWPRLLPPQHVTPPEVWATQVCRDPSSPLRPPASSVSASLTPATAVGAAIGGPTMPDDSPAPFEPQHSTVPSFIRAHEWEGPSAISRAPVVPLAMIGLPLGAPSIPLPSWP